MMTLLKIEMKVFANDIGIQAILTFVAIIDIKNKEVSCANSS